MGGLGDEQALLAKARAAGSAPEEVLSRNIDSSHSSKAGMAVPSWREEAKSVKLSPRNVFPKIREFERSVLPSLRTLRAQFICGLCPFCGRPMIESVLSEHVSQCHSRRLREEESGEEKVLEAKLDAGTSSSLGADEVAGSLSSNKKKRKHGEVEANSKTDDAKVPAAASRRAKLVAKPKAPKPAKPSKTSRSTKPPKVPKQSKEKPVVVYNPDKNCGVILPSGLPCMRSLTCKQHSMGAKRSVPGRSMAYDVLLSNYHKQHQIKQAQLSASAAQAARRESDQLQEAQAQQNPEREVQQVLEGVSRAIYSPLAVGKVTSTASRVTNFRLREMLAVALLPRRLPPTGDVLYGRSLAFKQDTPEKLMYVRSQAVQQAMYISQLQQRQMQLRRQAEFNTSRSSAPTSLTSQLDQQGLRLQQQHQLKQQQQQQQEQFQGERQEQQEKSQQ